MAFTNAEMERLHARLLEASSGGEFVSFVEKLTPGAQDVLGVRVPQLRLIAKELMAADWRGYLASGRHDYHEYDMLSAIIIANAKCGLDERFELASQFLPHMNNWCVTDTIGMGFKCARKHQAECWSFIEQFFMAEHEFTRRFPIVVMLSCYLNDEYIDRVLKALLAIGDDRYYVRMALAWAYSGTFIKHAEKAMPIFEHGLIKDSWVHNKAIQKSLESFRVSDDVKQHLRALRRK